MSSLIAGLMDLALLGMTYKVLEKTTEPLMQTVKPKSKVEPPKFERVESNPFSLDWARKLQI